MNITVRKLSIFVFISAATTALTIGSTTTFAASNTHTHHHIQLMGNGDSWASSFTHPPYSTGTAWNQPHHHHSSTDMIAHIKGDNSNSTVGSVDPGSFSSIQYAWNHPHHHHSSTDMIAHIKGDNSNSTCW